MKILDTSRDQLDVNCLVNSFLELIQPMPYMFTGRLTSFERESLRLECLSELANRASFIDELKKLYRAEMANIKKGLEKPKELRFRNGEFCLIDCTPQVGKKNTTLNRSKQRKQRHNASLRTSESLMSLNEQNEIDDDNYEDDDDDDEVENVTTNNHTLPMQNEEVKLDYCRGIILDVNAEKCVLFNLDFGKSLVVNRKVSLHRE